MIGMWVMVLKISYKVLFPLIIIFCLIGAYSVHMNAMDILIMLVFGVFGYFMKKFEYDVALLVLAFIPTLLMETAFRQSLIVSRGILVFLSYVPTLSLPWRRPLFSWSCP